MAAGRADAPPKPATLLAGRPLVSYPLEALSAVCPRVAVACKRDTDLLVTPGFERWIEPDEPRHPLTGLTYALERAGGPVLVCAGDMPYVTAQACRALIEAALGSGAQRRRGRASAVVVAESSYGLEPLLGVYNPGVLPALQAARPGIPLRAAVEALTPERVALPEEVVRSVNTPDDLAAAEAELAAAR